jgi:hypothetical protein
MSAYIFGAICPAKGKGAGLVMPWCDTAAMQDHLEEISAAVAPGAHAVVILDQAGWHLSGRLGVPANITLLPLPPRRKSVARHLISRHSLFDRAQGSCDGGDLFVEVEKFISRIRCPGSCHPHAKMPT